MLEVGTTLQGKYQIQSPPIISGFTIGYRAIHTATQQNVMVKMLHPELRDRNDFMTLQHQSTEQIRRLAQCNHSHLARVLDTFTLDDPQMPIAAWVMDDSPGLSLTDLVQTTGPLHEGVAIRYITQIGKALAELHRCGIVHGGVQPQHIRRLASTEAVVLTDIGLMGDTFANLGANHPERLASGYAAVEQYHAPVTCTPATDIYGLAATLYYILSGHVPTPASLREQIELPPLRKFRPELSTRTEQAVLSGMGLMATQRPVAIAEWLDLLPTGKPASKPVSLPHTATQATTAATVAVAPAAHIHHNGHQNQNGHNGRAAMAEPTVMPPTRANSVDADRVDLNQNGTSTSKRSKAKSKRWPLALALTAIAALVSGGGVGLALRFQAPEPGQNTQLGLGSEQSFPESENWPGSDNPDDVFFEDADRTDQRNRDRNQSSEWVDQPVEERADPPPMIEEAPAAEPVKAAPPSDSNFGGSEPFIESSSDDVDSNKPSRVSPSRPEPEAANPLDDLAPVDDFVPDPAAPVAPPVESLPSEPAKPVDKPDDGKVVVPTIPAPQAAPQSVDPSPGSSGGSTSENPTGAPRKSPAL